MTVLKTFFPAPETAHLAEYNSLFKSILKVRDTVPAEAWGAEIKQIIKTHFANGYPPVSEFPEKPGYSRNLIGIDETSTWQSMISRWQPQALSTVHGHPDFIFYYVLQGSFTMPFFRCISPGSDKVELTHTQTLQAGEAVFSVGKPGLFDNMIHQVQANEPSLALHVFSDDALKGKVFTL